MTKPERFEHESYGMISFSRTMNGGRSRLFGSSLDSHYSTIRMTVQRGTHEHDLHEDRFYGKGGLPLIEVEMSAAQFAELITSMNMGSGVPCTLRHVNGSGKMRLDDPPEQKTEVQRVKDNFRADLSGMVDEMRERRNTIDKLCEKLPAKSREQIRIALDVIIQQLSSNVPFVMEQFNEATDRVVAAAKKDIEAFAMHALHVAGREALKPQLTVHDAKQLPAAKPEPAKCDCELRDRKWNGHGRCLRCGRQYVDGRTHPPPYCKEPQACLEYEGCDCRQKSEALRCPRCKQKFRDPSPEGHLCSANHEEHCDIRTSRDGWDADCSCSRGRP